MSTRTNASIHADQIEAIKSGKDLKSCVVTDKYTIMPTSHYRSIMGELGKYKELFTRSISRGEPKNDVSAADELFPFIPWSKEKDFIDPNKIARIRQLEQDVLEAAENPDLEWLIHGAMFGEVSGDCPDHLRKINSAYEIIRAVRALRAVREE